tara:strand:+ start:119 stop:1396 length:1278 start_codon:yes stop_codon:yes gene_type:complete
MNVNTLNFNDQKITLSLYLLIFINYLGIFFSYNENFIIILAYSIVIIFFISIFLVNQNNYLLKCLMLVFLLFCLGSPTFHFDARWIWLFKGKQIFINNNLDFLREDYFQGLVWQSYPLLGPSLSSSLAKIFGYWNEVFPKTFNVILSLPPLIYLNSLIKKKINKLIFILIILLVLEKSLIIGEMDGLVAIYFVTIFCIFFKKIFKNNFFSKKEDKFIFSKNEKLNVFFFILSLITMTLLKKESLLLISILVVSMIICKFYLEKIKLSYKYLIISSLCFLPLLSWELYLINQSIFSTEHPTISNIFKGDLIFLFERVTNFRDILSINSKIFLNKSFFISLVFLGFVLGGIALEINNKLKNQDFKLFILYFILVFILYILAFNLIFLFTSYDLDFHLRTSAHRIMLPLSFLISYISLVLIEKLSLYK